MRSCFCVKFCEAKGGGGGGRWSLACDVASHGVSPFGEAFLTVKSNVHSRDSYRCLPAQEIPPPKKDNLSYHYKSKEGSSEKS